MLFSSDWRTKHHQDGITNDLINRALMLINNLNHLCQIVIEHADDYFSRQTFAHLGKTAQIAQHQTDRTLFTAELQTLRCLQQMLGDIICQVTPHHTFDKAFFFMATGHVSRSSTGAPSDKGCGSTDEHQQQRLHFLTWQILRHDAIPNDPLRHRQQQQIFQRTHGTGSQRNAPRQMQGREGNYHGIPQQHRRHYQCIWLKVHHLDQQQQRYQRRFKHGIDITNAHGIFPPKAKMPP